MRALFDRRRVAILAAAATIVGCSAVLGIDDLPPAGNFAVQANGRNCNQLEADLSTDLGSVCPACVTEHLPITSFTCTPAMGSQQLVAYCTCQAPDAGSSGGAGSGGSMGSAGAGGMLGAMGVSGATGSGGTSGGGMGGGGMAGTGGEMGSRGRRGSGGSGGSGGSSAGCDAGIKVGGQQGVGTPLDAGLVCKTNPVTCEITCYGSDTP